jgi:Secretion system C-terminal sorting domain
VPPPTASYTISNLPSGWLGEGWLMSIGTTGVMGRQTRLLSPTYPSLGTTQGCSSTQPAPTITHVTGHCSQVNFKVPVPTVTVATTTFPLRLYWYRVGGTSYSVVADSVRHTTSYRVTNLQTNANYGYYYRVNCTGGASVLSLTTIDQTCSGPSREKKPEEEHTVYEVNGVYYVDYDMSEVILAASSGHEEEQGDGQEHEYALHKVSMDNAIEEMNSTAQTTTTSQEELTGSFSLIPNPTTSRVKVEYDLPQEGLSSVTISMLDMSGRELRHLVVEHPSKTGYVSIDLQDVSTGMYLVQVNTNGYHETQKLVVSK